MAAVANMSSIIAVVVFLCCGDRNMRADKDDLGVLTRISLLVF